MSIDRINEAYYGTFLNDNTQKALKQRIDWMINSVKGHQVLDIGCSQGIVSILLGRMNISVLGIDVNDEAIKYANLEKSKEDVSTQNCIEFLKTDIFQYHPQREFDSIILGEVLEHLENPKELLDKCLALLKDQGRLIVTVPFGVNPHDDHCQTFYPGSFLSIFGDNYKLEDSRIIGKWLCFAFTKDTDGKLSLDYNDLLRMSEQAFYNIEQEYLASIKKYKERSEDLLAKNTKQREKIHKLGEVYNSRQYKIGKKVLQLSKPFHFIIKRLSKKKEIGAQK